jgi:hypothetical protein
MPKVGISPELFHVTPYAPSIRRKAESARRLSRNGQQKSVHQSTVNT